MKRKDKKLVEIYTVYYRLENMLKTRDREILSLKVENEKMREELDSYRTLPAKIADLFNGYK